MIIIVSGLGRCGSSLTMQMLDAAGIPCNGKYPAFESPRGGLSLQDPNWLTKQQGKATKILLPYLYKFLPADYRFIWVDREPIHQACSTMKFKHMLIAPEKNQKMVASNITKMAHAYPKDKEKAFKQMRKFGQVLTITFEELINTPNTTALFISEYLNMKLDTTKMTSVVIPRSTNARLDMQLETQLIKERI